LNPSIVSALTVRHRQKKQANWNHKDPKGTREEAPRRVFLLCVLRGFVDQFPLSWVAGVVRPGILWALFCLLCIGLYSPHSALARSKDKTPADSQKMTANLDGVPLGDFIRFVSRFTGRNIVFRDDQIPKTKVSIQTRGPLTEPELLSVFESILAGNNLELVSQNNVLYVLRPPSVLGIKEPFASQPGQGDERELLTSVIQLKARVPLQEGVEMLKPFLSRYAKVQAIPQARAVLIRDTRQNLDKISNILDRINDLQPKWHTELLDLQQAKAEEAADKVHDLFAGLVEQGQVAQSPVILPVPWSNALLVAGTRDQIATVRELTRNLDQIDQGAPGLKIYALKNAKAEAAADVLRELLRPTSDTKDQLQEDVFSRLVISPDQQTNSILVLADPQTLPQIDSIMDHLDQPLAQVFVEALIVETTLEQSQEFGVEWLAGGGGSDGIVTGGFVSPNSRLGPLLSEPAPPVAPGGFTIGALGNTVTYAGKKFSTLGALVSFLKTASEFNILSTPQIMTLDNSQAEIFIGENRPYMVNERIDPEGNVIQSFDYRDVGIRLVVTPNINTQNQMIRMEVEQEVKNVLEQGSTNAPTTMNRNTRTNVQLPSGSTMVISGLIENSTSRTRRAIPVISQIPGLGWLARQETSSAPKTTLMVFLSARIIENLDQADELTKERMDQVQKSRQEQKEILEREFWGSSR